MIPPESLESIRIISLYKIENISNYYLFKIILLENGGVFLENGGVFLEDGGVYLK